MKTKTLQVNSWPGGRRHAMHQADHKRWNAAHYPGTRQLCSKCGEPTGRCEEDAMWSDEGEPLCETCHCPTTDDRTEKPLVSKSKPMKEKLKEAKDRMEREAKLFAALGTRAAGRRLELNIAAVPIDDPLRVLLVSEEEFEEAEELGFQKIYGLRLVVG